MAAIGGIAFGVALAFALTTAVPVRHDDSLFGYFSRVIQKAIGK